MAKAEYRSAIRSKSLIKKALATLMHEKDINKITVSDIIREADISRGTFYAHYPDIYSVLDQIETEELKKLMCLVNKSKEENSKLNNPTDFLTVICNYLYSDFDYYRMLLQSSFLNNFLNRLIEVYYEDTIAALLEKDASKDVSEAVLYLTYTTAGAKQVIVSWLQGKINGTPENVASRLAKLIELSNNYYKTEQA